MSAVHVAIPAIVVQADPGGALAPRTLDRVLRARIEDALRERSDEYVTYTHGAPPRVDAAKLQALVAGTVRQTLAEGRR